MTLNSQTRAALIDQELARVDGHTPSAGDPISIHVAMAGNPCRFLRGATRIFYADLRHGSLALPDALLERVPLTTVMGDCHLSNLGLISEDGSYGDHLIYSPNDFDCLSRKKAGKRLKDYAAACGRALTLAHSPGDLRSTRFEAAFAFQLIGCEKTLIDVSRGYAQQTIGDWRILRDLMENTKGLTSPNPLLAPRNALTVAGALF